MLKITSCHRYCEPTKRGALLDHLCDNRKNLAEEVMVGNCLGHSDQELVEFKMLI